MSTSTDRHAFRTVVAAIAAKAEAKLPECNGRIAKATALVLAGDVELHEGGTATVYSATDPTRRYELGSGYCMCRDWEQAPQHLCKHRLAAMMAKRVQELLPVEPPVEPWADNDPESDLPELAEAPAVPARPAPAVPLPEAPVSITLKAMLHGHEVLVTLRGTDFASVREQVEAASQWLRSQTPAPVVDVPQCPIHHVAMKENEKDGRTWFSHKTADGWCKGKRSR
jgi:hypothetical protein